MLVPYDDSWPATAAREIGALRRALAPLDPGGSFAYDHIGSTSVPGLAAKPLVDLQVRVPTLPEAEEMDRLLASIGYLASDGSRPDSPGVRRDHPRGSDVVPDEVWEKRLYVRAAPDAVLHVRRSDSPWGRYTVLFRDWLRAHLEEAARYEQTKLALAGEHAHDPDFDDYTRAKTAYFDRVQPLFERWGRPT